MGLFNSIVDSFESTGGQIGAVVGGLVGGVPGAVAGAVLGNEVDYWTNQAGDALGAAVESGFEWIEEGGNTIEERRNQLGDEVAYQIEYAGMEGGDITNWVDNSTYSDYAYQFGGAVGKFDHVDDYSFTLNYSSNFYAALTDLASDVDIKLLNSNFEEIGSSLNYGTDNEYVNAILGPGTYYLDVVTGDYTTSVYTLEIGSTLV